MTGPGPGRCLAHPSFTPLVASPRSPPLRFSRLRLTPHNLRWRADRVSCFIRREDEPSCSVDGFGFVERDEGLEKSNGGGFGFVESDEESGDPRLDESATKRGTWVQIVNRLFKSESESWTVPWTAETIIQVMLLWIASFWLVGSWIIPFLAHAAGFRKETLTHRGQALYSLLTDIAEGLAGIAILQRCLTRFKPLPSGWFHFSLKGTWHIDVFLGCLLFPLVNFLSNLNINMVPVLPAPSVGVSSVEQSIVARDPVAMALYVVVVTVCAPVWEEIIFRGFLLPSLTKYMPLSSSIMVSAVAFALAHFNAQRLLPLVFLGVVMGVVFARSRNLLASMLLHSLWNGFVFLDLMK